MALFSEKADRLSAPGLRCDPQASPPRRKTRPASRDTPTSYSGSESEVPSSDTSTATSDLDEF
eukprot:1599325-Rhodomonas_salina.1